MGDKGINRRDFLKGAATTVAMFAMPKTLIAQNNEIATDSDDEENVKGPAVKIGVIGLGTWGRNILTTLSKQPFMNVTAICDRYQPAITRAEKIVTDAKGMTDYKELLSSDVEAVVIATPTHLHKQIVEDAVAADKHIYCEAPLAHTIDEVQSIANSAKNYKKVFQTGLQGRSNMLYNHIIDFVKTGVLGKNVLVQAQWNRKQSWKSMAPTKEREKELDWKISSETSNGLMGEVGIHQLDTVGWFLNETPKSAFGYGSIMNWNDGRDLPDTIKCDFEFSNNLRMVYTATLANSFSEDYILFQGTDSSIVMRENVAWLVKEADSPLLGWEVYARKEDCFGDTGICLIADSTKILEEGREPGEDGAVEPEKDALTMAFENFAKSIREDKPNVSDIDTGFYATINSIKANEAIMKNIKVEMTTLA
ncbi:MAG: Gfo/Idh/MocA family oxidoreductase [Armatimonadota bacterium]